MAGPLEIAATALGSGAGKAGVVLAALLAGGAVLARSPRARAWAMLGALVLTPVLLLAEVWDTAQVRPLREDPLLAVLGALAALAAVGAVAFLFHRRPRLFPLLAVAALPFRVPIESAGATVNLLVPLYLVIAAGALAYLVPRLRAGSAGEPSEDGEPSRTGALEIILLGFVVLYAVQSLYSEDFSRALVQVVFFYVPFALLFGLLLRTRWDRDLVFRCLGVLVVLALVFASVGFVEYATRDVLLNPRVIRTNEFSSYFRVNSLFFDPNIYGRFLVVVMLGVTGAMLWSTRRRNVAGAAALLLVLWGALLLTLSQSSFGGLLVGLGMLAALRWSARWTVTLGVLAVALGAAFVLAFPGVLRLDLKDTDKLNRATSGRVALVEGAAILFTERPVAGWGSGSFRAVFQDRRDASRRRATAASHNVALTAAAEQGAIGLLAYLVLIVVAFRRLLKGARRDVARAVVAAAFAALVCHTMLYAAFLEDPMAWTLLGVGAALSRPSLGSPVFRAWRKSDRRTAERVEVAAS